MLPLRKLQYAAGAAGLLVLASLIVARTTAQSPPSELVLIASSAIQAEIVPCG
jgi:hypothetical protein